MELPFTERTNPLSKDLDGSLSSGEFLRVLRSCDSQIYGGFEGQPSCLDTPCLESMNNTINLCADVLTRDGLVVLSGCGTSGRIAYLLSRRYNDLSDQAQAAKELNNDDKESEDSEEHHADANIASSLTNFTKIHNHYDYAIAGGDSAILLSDEMPEDDPLSGSDDLQAAVNRQCDGNSNINSDQMIDKTCIIAISCGLSAPYCGGQVARAVIDHYAGAVLLGFNPPHLSRPVTLRSMDSIKPTISKLELDKPSKSTTTTLPWKTFKDCVEYLHENTINPTSSSTSKNYDYNKYTLINPILGPEALTGSSRMKGGTATMAPSSP